MTQPGKDDDTPKTRLILVGGLTVSVVLATAWLILPSNSGAGWGENASDAQVKAARAAIMCSDLVTTRGFKERLQEIPIYPDMFCRCVADQTYEDDGGDQSKPYGTYASESYDQKRADFLIEVQACLQ